MYGSASTWTFNAVRQVAAAVMPDRPVTTLFVSDSVADVDAAEGTVVVKTHATPAVNELAERASTIVITVRDPRDAVASLLAHNKAPFELAVRAIQATALMCARFATDPRAIFCDSRIGSTTTQRP
jgi:hypothetical protein